MPEAKIVRFYIVATPVFVTVCVCNESAHDRTDRQDFIDATGSLACPKHTLMLTACLGGRDNLTPQAIALLTRLFALAAPPRLRMGGR